MLIWALFALFSLASDLEKTCTYFHESGPGLQYYRQFFSPNTCYLDLQPTQYEKMKFRAYLFSNTGLFMVFNSYNESEDSSATGARVFYFFPRNKAPERIVQGSILKIFSSDPKSVFSFDLNKGIFTGLSVNGKIADIFVDPDIHAKNNGGVEIKNYKGLMLDLGFALGQDPAMVKDRKVKFIDSNQIQCILKNREIFKYIGSDYEFIHASDAELKVFLQKRCPELTLSSLE